MQFAKLRLQPNMHTQSITRIQVSLQVKSPVAWPHYAGSTLRGAWGRALRRAACITGQSHCQGCPVRAHCAYGDLFDPAPPAQPLHPSFRDGVPRYLLLPPALGACKLVPSQTQDFELRLLPGAQSHLSLVRSTLASTLARELFQPNTWCLQGIQEDTVQHPSLPQPPATIQAHSAQVTLRWHTPLRLQLAGRVLFKPEQLDASTLVRAAHRRLLQWCQLSGQQPPQQTPWLDLAQQCSLQTSNLRWHDIDRRSGTQQQRVPMGGLIGSARLGGPQLAMSSVMSLLNWVEPLHLGKDTVMGLGRFQVQDTQAVGAQPVSHAQTWQPPAQVSVRIDEF